jgi:hypothetical protein
MKRLDLQFPAVDAAHRKQLREAARALRRKNA